MELRPQCTFFFFTDPATTEIYTLSLHDALPISHERRPRSTRQRRSQLSALRRARQSPDGKKRSEEHTSELQSRGHLVCRLLLEKKKITITAAPITAYTYPSFIDSPTSDDAQPDY